jgi:hypothetical protein
MGNTLTVKCLFGCPPELQAWNGTDATNDHYKCLRCGHGWSVPHGRPASAPPPPNGDPHADLTRLGYGSDDLCTQLAAEVAARITAAIHRS